MTHLIQNMTILLITSTFKLNLYIFKPFIKLTENLLKQLFWNTVRMVVYMIILNNHKDFKKAFREKFLKMFYWELNICRKWNLCIEI